MAARQPGPWRIELGDFCRAFSGAFLFGIPLLYTQEMWSLGSYVTGWKLLGMLLIAFVVNLGLSYFAGFKSEQPRDFVGHLDQAIDAVAVGAVASAVVLLVLNRVSPSDPLDSILGTIVVQVPPLSIGASVARDLFAAGMGRQGGEPRGRAVAPWQATLRDLGATMAGGIFVGFNTAPTEEIRLLAAEMPTGHLMGLMLFSIAVIYAIVFESGFSPDARRPEEQGFLQDPVSETAMAYAVSLVVALGALSLFNEADFADPIASLVSQTLVIGLPTAIGGAAGRLVI